MVQQCLSESADDAYPRVECPKCFVVRPDYDGFGLMYCDACQWCTHAAWTGTGDTMTCEFCGITQKSIL